jgi:hypothetical protein
MLKESVPHLKLRLPPPITQDALRVPGGFQAAKEVVQANQSWWGSKHSDILWVQNCRREMDEPSVARDMAAFTDEAPELIVLRYFCRRIDANGLPFDKAEQISDLLCSFINQLYTSLTEDLITSLDPSASRFSGLDGSLESAGLALKLLVDLLSIVSGPILVIVDKLEILEFSGDAILEGNPERLIDILKNEKSDAVKILFTTVENLVLIMDAMGWEKTVDVGSGSDGFMTLEGFVALRVC